MTSKLPLGAGGRRLAAVAVAALLIATSATASAAGAGSEQGGELYSIEKRKLMGSHELSVMIGTLPMDAFGTGLTLQGSYTYHFTHMIGWEIAGGTWSFILGTGLQEQLRERFDVQPERAGDLEAMVHSNFVFKPLYGKIAVINDILLAAEMFFVLGPAVGFFSDQSVPFGLDGGIGLRLFLGRYFSVRLDIRDYMFLPDFKEVDNHLYVSLGLSLTFGFSDEKTEEE